MKLKINFNLKRKLKDFWNWLKFYSVNIYEKMDKHHAFIFASGMTYNILLCIIPMVLIVFSVLGSILQSQELLIQISLMIDDMIPISDYSDKVKEILFERIGEFIKYKTLVGSLGIAGLFFTASGLFSTLRTILNNIYGIEKGKNILIAKIRDLGMVILTLVFFLVVILLNPLIQIFKAFLGKIEILNKIDFSILDKFLIGLLPYILTFLMMFLIYSLVPYRKMKKRVYFVSAFWATVFFHLAQVGFTYYVTNIANYSRIYGNVAFVIVTALWLYIISVIFILAAIIGQTYREKHDLMATKTREGLFS
ncbi:MAG: YihY/virulence factor BrkB family protein [Ignavibacteria bacterium]|jgi:membrane protein|nr:YihY/virulence factor BrkB family protein [Ignavibacteria bacterium]MDH7528656.1 YihY/virulence factor BrkB family protein [Ignavibacteria bacterium]NPV11127.1 YihY/virulence factor BrkB family protein [Ignavibacteria bacterium]